MTGQTTGPENARGPVGRLTDAVDKLTNAEQLTALGTYIKTLKAIEDGLRASVTEDLKARRVEKVGAYLPGGEKIGAVAYRAGNKSATVTDSGAALRWALARHPEAVVQMVAPAFLKSLTDYAAKVGQPGEPGVDPETGEVLDFIEVRQGRPYVTVTTTPEGVARMTALAHGFAGMLESSNDEDARLDALLTRTADAAKATLDAEIDVEQKLAETLAAAGYDPAFADRLENGAYER